MEDKVFYDNCFLSLGYEDEKEDMLFIMLKGAFDVYIDKILQTRDIKFADKTWGYCRLQNPREFMIFDTYSNEEYAKIIFKNKEIEIKFNECSLSGWLTQNKLEPNNNLISSIKSYLQNLKFILKEMNCNDHEIKSYIMKKASIICDSITILDRTTIINIAKYIILQ
jgi:hypothetical protein